jgi:hypothetical protein
MAEDKRFHWDPEPGDEERIRQHLERQRGVAAGFVRLDTGVVVAEGDDAKGEGDDYHG